MEMILENKNVLAAKGINIRRIWKSKTVGLTSLRADWKDFA